MSTHEAKSIILSRKPGAKGEEHYMLLVALFEHNNAHKAGETPKQVLEFPNIEKVRLRNLNISYYLDGNDLIVNDLSEITINQEGDMIVLEGKQE
tara:strand:- start:187 stop:471 length:285 start_codon:yes stop_codon:yes gene_type:complete